MYDHVWRLSGLISSQGLLIDSPDVPMLSCTILRVHVDPEISCYVTIDLGSCWQGVRDGVGACGSVKYSYKSIHNEECAKYK